MGIQEIRQRIPEYAKDLKLNLSSVLTPEGAPGLTVNQIYGVALASAIAAPNPGFARAVEAEAAGKADEATINGAKAAAAIMGMNNVYYRFTHLVEDTEYASMPAKLRMTVIGKPGIPKPDFELYCLAVSAIYACGTCITAHDREL